MNAKERFYSGLARETIGKITSNKDNWTSFLVTMSRNYEFTYPEQVMIYSCGAFAGSRISLWTIPRFSG